MSTTNENIEAVKKMILGNCRITIRKVADDFGISFDSFQVIFTDVLGTEHAAAKTVPKLLNFGQKIFPIDFTEEILTTFNDDPDLFKKVVSGDESWL